MPSEHSRRRIALGALTAAALVALALALWFSRPTPPAVVAVAPEVAAPGVAAPGVAAPLPAEPPEPPQAEDEPPELVTEQPELVAAPAAGVEPRPCALLETEPVSGEPDTLIVEVVGPGPFEGRLT